MNQMPPTRRAPRVVGGALRRRMLHAPVGAATLCVAMLAGCADSAIAPHVPAPPVDATPLYWSLRNDHRAVTLSTTAPFDTLRITAVPHDGAGRPLTLEGSLTYTSSQPSRVQVSAGGLIRAIAPGTNVYVISALVANNVRHVDTTVVHVTAHASPPTVALFSAQPVAPDSARWAVHKDPMSLFPDYVKRLPLRVEDAAGRAITGVAVRYTSSDPVMAPIHSFNGELKSNRTGPVTLTAEATVYGTKWTDSVEFEFDWPVIGWAVITNSAPPGEAPRLGIDHTILRIGKGGVAAFSSTADIAVGIEFDDPTLVAERTALGCPIFPDQGGSGNIAPFGGGPVNVLLNCRSRRFPVAGVYTFRLTPDGPTGKIIVEESAL